MVQPNDMGNRDYIAFFEDLSRALQLGLSPISAGGIRPSDFPYVVARKQWIVKYSRCLASFVAVVKTADLWN